MLLSVKDVEDARLQEMSVSRLRSDQGGVVLQRDGCRVRVMVFVGTDESDNDRSDQTEARGGCEVGQVHIGIDVI